MFRRVLLTGFAGFLLCTLASGADSSGVETWFVDSLTKVFPADMARETGQSIPEIPAARNQHVAIQLALRSARPLKGVSAVVEPLKGLKQGVIRSVTVHPVGYVVVGSHTKDTPPEELIGETPGWYPDPLLDFPVDVPARRTQTLWVTVAVPAEAVPGRYDGTIVVKEGDRVLAQRRFRVKVLAAVVPSARSLTVTNWFTLGAKASKQFYGLEQFSPEWWTLVENVARVMADHRQNMVITPLMNLIKPQVVQDELAYDFSNFDRWVETFQRAGVIGYIEGSHLLGRAGSYDAGLETDIVVIEDGKARGLTVSPDDPRVAHFLTVFLTALNAHLEEKKWKSIYFQHILDEAHGEEPPYYARFAEIVYRCLPGVPTMDAVDAAHMPTELRKNCDVWVPLLGRFDDQMNLIEERIQSGHPVWFYTCLFPNGRYLNRLMDYPLLKVRLLHWLNFRYNLTGYLHWGWNYWSPEPMNDTQPVIDDNTELLPSGDAFIVYPDRARKSVFSSVRLETMRAGIEDYEMLRALHKKNPAEADGLAKAAITSLTEYVRTPEPFRRIESQLLEALSK
ncbi:MAG: DUF4091 domain-containing protein [Acidobacteriia bacterium]|nr:DUF4091 domain-containing protein [Terriglobia bacterium]